MTLATPDTPTASGRIDVHAHLLPGVDDGCQTMADAIACCRMLADAGYTHAFCTPHAWLSLKSVTHSQVPRWVADLQTVLDGWHIPLRLIPGAEMNLNFDPRRTPDEQVISMALAGRYILTDFWAATLPPYFETNVRWLQKKGLTVVLAHPERVQAIQDRPGLVDQFADMGILLQGNLQCLSDPPAKRTRQVAERYLKNGRYFLLGSDTHNAAGLVARLDGLKSAIAMVGREAVDRLTVDHPRQLLGPS